MSASSVSASGRLRPILSDRPYRLTGLGISAFLLLAAAQGGVVWALYASSRRAVANVLDGQMQTTAATAAAALRLAVDNGLDEAGLAEALRRIRDANHLEHALVVDAAARVVVDPSGLAVGERPSVLGVAPDRVRQAIVSGSAVFERPILIGDATRQAYLPVTRGGTLWGVLCLEMADPLPEVLFGLRRPFVLALAGVGVIAAALALALVAALRLRDHSRRRVQQVESLATAGKLAAGIAHEVKNPLGMILASAQLLERSPGLDPADRRLLGEIAEEVSRADDQLDGFLDLVREMPLKVAPFDLREVVRACAELVAAQARRLGLSVTLSVPDAPVPVSGDRRRIRQALVNLVLNALEATDAGGTVTVTVSRSADLATIAVADSGPGIPPALQARLFEPFVTSKPHGTGLGLSTARRIIARHHGQLRLVATGPGGTTFALDLPCGPT